MSGFFRNIDPPPPHSPASVRGRHTRWVERGWGVNSSEDAADTALYSTYVSTLWLYLTPLGNLSLPYHQWGEGRRRI
jgi:hypothetical protein